MRLGKRGQEAAFAQALVRRSMQGRRHPLPATLAISTGGTSTWSSC